jgi:hypothetical protein
MTKSKEHPKLLNEFMLHEGLEEINSVFGILIAFKAYIKSDSYHKYHAEMVIDSIQNLLSSGTQIIEEWMQIEDVAETEEATETEGENKNV